MASIQFPATGRQLDAEDDIREHLAPLGIHYERWPVESRVAPDAEPEAILEAYSPEIERLKERGGYVTADVISVTPETPGLDAMLAKFSREHTHAEDEVRFILAGRGLFYIHVPEAEPDSRVFAIQVEAGDLINVPARTRHWFDLCEERRIRAIRLFIDPAGWAPDYLEDGVDAQHQPLCWGPGVLPAES